MADPRPDLTDLARILTLSAGFLLGIGAFPPASLSRRVCNGVLAVAFGLAVASDFLWRRSDRE